MTELDATLPTFRYLAGETENICRLCFGLIYGNGATLDETRTLQTAYFDDTIAFYEIFLELGITVEDGLPQKLCQNCVDSAINSFLFLKLCQYTHNRWLESIEQFNKTLDLANSLGPTAKTAYLVVTNDCNSTIYTSKKKLKNKEDAIKKITSLIRAKKTYYKKARQESATICHECGAKFSWRKHLIRHIRKMHSSIQHTCKYCSKVFPTAAQVIGHIDRVHKPKTVQCPKCDKSFSTHKLLKIHNSNLHQAVICKHCFIQFPSKKDLKQHLDKHDVNNCPRCNKTFNNKYSLKFHIKICGNDMEKQLKFFCDLCNKGYRRKNGLRSHLITEHKFGTVFPCKWCNKPFDAPSKLKNHIVKHTRERNFHCTQCGSVFVTHAALIYHTRLHTGEKPFPCDMCDESFLSASRRMEHKRRKHLNSFKICPLCYRTFVTNHELKKHVVRHQNPKSRLFVAENELSGSNTEVIVLQN